MQARHISCRCGAKLVVGPSTPSIVCASCHSTIAVPQEGGAAADLGGFEDTMLHMTPMASPASQPPVDSLGATKFAVGTQVDRGGATVASIAAVQVAANATLDQPATTVERPKPPAAPAPRARPTRSTWPIILVGLLVVGAAIGGALYITREKPTPEHDNVVAPAPSHDGGTSTEANPIEATSPEELVVMERKALSLADSSMLASLLAPNAFAFGFDAGEVATTGPAAAALIKTMLGGKGSLTSTWSQIVRDRDIAWIGDELQIESGGKIRKIMTSQLAYMDGKTWRIAAWHLGTLVGNQQAYRLAKAGLLPQPAEIVDQLDDDHQVHEAFRIAFDDRAKFAEMFSEHPNAIDLGSAPGERLVGGKFVKKWASAVKATFKIHDGVAAGRVSDRAGWGAGNVDFTLDVDGAPTTQTFRVLAVLVREKSGWRVVMAQWSNAGPIPR